MQNRRPKISSLDSLENKAVLYLDKGKLRAAEGVLKKMLGIDSNSLAAHFHLARVFRRLQEYKKALHHGRRTIRLNAKEQNAYLNLALIYDEMGQDNLAIRFYKKELESNPDSPETHWNLGRLYYRLHRWRRASECLQRCYDMSFSCEVEDTVDKLAICYKRLGEVSSYIRLFEDYVRIAPRAAWAFVNLGRALLFIKNHKRALIKLQRAETLGAGEKVGRDISRAKNGLMKSRIIPAASRD